MTQCEECGKGFITTSPEFMTTKPVPTESFLEQEQERLSELTKEEIKGKTQSKKDKAGSDRVELLQYIDDRTHVLNETPDFEQHRFCSNTMCDYNERLFRIIPI